MKTRHFNMIAFAEVWQAMRDFTDSRTDQTPDELWIVEHPPVYTLGQSGKREHVLAAGEIPIVQTDRGGQVTYHGPGQLVIYILLDLKRQKLGIRKLVSILEQSVIDLLADYNIKACARADAPGVYIQDKKICSIGLRVRRGCSYHGLALNVNMDIKPFQGINPCGYAGLEMTQLMDFGVNTTPAALAPSLISHLKRLLLEKRD